jgi:hypothetical protein
MLKFFVIAISAPCFLLMPLIVPVSANFAFQVTSKSLDTAIRRNHDPMNMNTFSKMEDVSDMSTRTYDDGGHETIFLENVDRILNTSLENASQSKEDALAMIDASHAKDAEFCASLGTEESSISMRNAAAAPKIIPYEWIYANEDGEDHFNEDPSVIPLAIRTIDLDQPILDQESISIIRGAAENMWEAIRANPQSISTSSSRFTYQRKGNYEAHLVDLADNVDGRIRNIIMDALGQKIYPLVRDAFRPLISELDDLNFCVYDSLVIRYNSTEALMMDNPSKAQGFGAGQPLHRDLGLVSVNIMLNSAEEFKGGGTFLENQLRGKIAEKGLAEDVPSPLQSIGAGHAVAHLSNQRHAGVGTTEGVRDILVLFLTASRKSSVLHNFNEKSINVTPDMERAARLKTNARSNSLRCDTLEESILVRMMHHRLAIQFAPADEEAWHYLGMTLLEYAKTKKETQKALEIARLSISCLNQAFAINPCDGRLCNNLGLAHETLLAYTTATTKESGFRNEDSAVEY